MQDQQKLIELEMEKRELEDFDSQFDSLMKTEHTQAKKVPVVSQRWANPIILPVSDIKKKLPEAAQSLQTEGKAGQEEQVRVPQIMKQGMIPFALISRKGNRTKLDKIELPSSSQIVINAKQRIEEEKLAKFEIKEQTMQQIANQMAHFHQNDHSNEELPPGLLSPSDPGQD
mmetsp:Transcript_9493/g.15979  ORF Transcript_9493/g.15979 Transcript_9493/m.15979 type:complete len:172 (-) Transcript_9493:108-623(-)